MHASNPIEKEEYDTFFDQDPPFNIREYLDLIWKDLAPIQKKMSKVKV